MPWYSEACSSTLATTYSSGSTGEKQVRKSIFLNLSLNKKKYSGVLLIHFCFSKLVI